MGGQRDDTVGAKADIGEAAGKKGLMRPTGDSTGDNSAMPPKHGEMFKPELSTYGGMAGEKGYNCDTGKLGGAGQLQDGRAGAILQETRGS